MKIRYITPRELCDWVERNFELPSSAKYSDPTHSEYKYGQFLEEVANPLIAEGYEILYIDWYRAITVLIKKD